MEKEDYIYYARCPLCPDYYEDATSVKDAREKLEVHEKEKHKGKQVGIFGWAIKKDT